MTIHQRESEDDLSESTGIEHFVKLAGAAAAQKNGERIEAFKMSDLLGIVDWFLLVSGATPRQVRTIAEEIEAELKTVGESPVRTEGLAAGEWALIDYGDLVVHVFSTEARDFYALDRLWADAPRLDLELGAAAI